MSRKIKSCSQKHIGRQEKLFMELQQLRRNFHEVPSYRIRFTPSGLSFQRGDVLPPDLEGNVDVLDRHWAVLDLVASNHQLKNSHGRVTQRGVQSSRGFCTLDLSRRKTFLVLGDSVNESKLFVLPWIVVMQTALVHPDSIFGLFSDSR